MNDSLKIALCTPRFAPQIGGAETWTREIANGLAMRGHQVTVIARAAPSYEVERDVRDVHVHRITGGRRAFARGIKAVVRQTQPDVVFSQFSALPFAIRAAHGIDSPAVAIVHDVYGPAESRRIRGPVAGTLRYFGLERSLRWFPPDSFVVPSCSTAARLQMLVRRGHISVVPAGADHLTPGEGGERDWSSVVFVGRLVVQKGVDDLLQAIRSLRRDGSRVHATIVGAGPHGPALQDAAADLGDAVQFTGRLDDAMLEKTIRTSGALILPSRREGWGLAVTEAAARGVPYVAYDIPAIREQHQALRGGLIVDPDPTSLARAIGSLLRDPSRAAALGARGRSAAAGMTWAAATEVVERAARQVLSGGSEPEGLMRAAC